MADADPVMLASILECGFEHAAAVAALRATNSVSVDAAVEWLLANPAPPTSTPAAASPPTSSATASSAPAAAPVPGPAAKATVQPQGQVDMQALSSAGAAAAKERYKEIM
eukprot:SAG31_NODE_16458_length_708_cov_1.211823_1_plen_109_part_10